MFCHNRTKLLRAIHSTPTYKTMPDWKGFLAANFGVESCKQLDNNKLNWLLSYCNGDTTDLDNYVKAKAKAGTTKENDDTKTYDYETVRRLIASELSAIGTGKQIRYIVYLVSKVEWYAEDGFERLIKKKQFRTVSGLIQCLRGMANG